MRKVLIYLYLVWLLTTFLRANPDEATDKLDLKQVETLIKQLDDDDWQKRKEATKRLEELSWNYADQIIPVLGKHLTEEAKPSPEMKIRINNILSLLENGRWGEKLSPAPIEGRCGHTVVCTGEKIVVWGGVGILGRILDYYKDGAIYDPKTNKWSELPPAPVKGRGYHTAVWTGEKMIIWGGSGGDRKHYADGAIYDPKANKWEELPPSPIKERLKHTTIWTGEKMIIWGGLGDVCHADGAIYDLKTNKWLELPPAPIEERNSHTAVWTGGKMIIWGGSHGMDHYYADGAIYDLKTNKWEKLPPAPIKERDCHTAIWTGDPAKDGIGKMIIWGGYNDENTYADGASYDPETNKWSELPAAPIKERIWLTAVWTGEKMVIWGGSRSGRESYADGAIYEFPKRQKK